MNTPLRLVSSLFAAAALAIGSTLSAQPTTLLSESFTSGIPSNWLTGAGTQSLVDGSSSPASSLDGNALRHNTTSNAGSNGLHYSQFASTTLGVGDSLLFTFDFKGVSYAQNAGNFFNFGILSSAGEDSFSLANTVGYAMAMRMDSRTDQTSGLRTFRTMDGGVLVATASSYGAGTTTGSPTFYPNDGNINDRLQFSFSITRLANDDLRLTATFLNVTQDISFSATYDVAAASLLNVGSDDAYTFDGVSIGFLRAGSSNSVFDVDNINVMFNAAIPEPGSYAALAGLAALSSVLLRRRGRGASNAQ